MIPLRFASSVVLGAILGAISALAACGGLLPTDDDAPSGPPTDAASPYSDATEMRDASGGSDGPCTMSCLLFRDDFERQAGDVRGGWTAVDGTPILESATGVGQGTVFAARGGAGTAPQLRASLLEKTLAPARGLAVGVTVEASVLADAGSFGSDQVNDWCELVTVLLGEKRIAMLYRDIADYWFLMWGPDEKDVVFSSIGPTFSGRASLRMQWTDAQITGAAVVGTGPNGTLARPLAVGAADAPIKLRLGYRCQGTTADMALVADDVEVRSNP